jgi:molybdate transport system regulatory protein
MGDIRLTLRVDFGADRALGPGKIRLLEAIDKTGSISQAGRSLAMSYRRAWLLVDDMNHLFSEPVVTTQPGGAQGGGATLTDFGKGLIKKYRRIEMQAIAFAQRQLSDLQLAQRTLNSASKLRKHTIRTGTARR